MKDRWVTLAVVIPLVGLAALVGRAEIARLVGPTWHIPISGYDPRDLLHGHYLRYQFRFDWQGESTCGTHGALSADCCLCLTRSNTEGIDPPVRQVRCDRAAKDCDGWLRSEALRPPLRYFVPEDRARELEDAFRHGEASLELTCGLDGRPAIRDLFLDGRPWREAVADGP